MAESTVRTGNNNKNSELWLKLISSHLSVQLAALDTIKSKIQQLSLDDPRRTVLIDKTLWPAVTAFEHHSLQTISSHVCLDLVFKTVLDLQDIQQRLLAGVAVAPSVALLSWARLLIKLIGIDLARHVDTYRASLVENINVIESRYDVQGADIHPFIVAIAQRSDIAPFIVLAYREELKSLLILDGTDCIESDANMLANIATHRPFIHYMLSLTLHQPKSVLEFQLHMLDALLSTMMDIPATFTRSSNYIFAVLMDHVLDFASVTQEHTLAGMYRIWQFNKAVADQYSLIQLLLNCIMQQWCTFRSISTNASAFLFAIINQTDRCLKNSECACIMSVASFILLDITDGSSLSIIVQLVSKIFQSVDKFDVALDPIFLAILFPLNAIIPIVGALYSSDSNKTISDTQSLFAGIMKKVYHRFTHLDNVDTEAQNDSSKQIIATLCKAQASASCIEYSQILGVSIKILLHETPSSYWHSDTLPELSMLMIGFGIFHPKSSIKYAYLTRLGGLIQDSHKPYLMKLFASIIYILKGKIEPATVHAIITKTIPDLSARKDPFLTSACIRFVLTLLAGENLNTSAELAGFESLIHICNSQPRIWAQVKTYIFQWLQRFKGSQGGGRIKTKAEIRILQDIEVFILQSVSQLSKQKPTQCGYDLLPFVIQYLRLSFASVSGQSIALLTISQAIRDNVSAPLTTWNVVMQNFVSNIKPDCPHLILESLCDYYSTVGEKMQFNEQYIAFASEILTLHLVPLTVCAVDSIKSAAFRALSKFPSSDVYPLLGLPQEFLTFQIPDQPILSGHRDLLCSLIEHECSTMRRPVFKGIASAEGVVGNSSQDTQMDAQTTLISKVYTICCSLTEIYESARFSSAARGGLAFAVLFSANKKEYVKKTVNFSKLGTHSLEFFQVGNAAIKDLVVTDFPLARSEAVEAWCTFWRNSFAQTARYIIDPESTMLPLEAIETLFEMLIGELVFDQIKGSKAPAVVANSLLSATGAVLAAHDLNFASACSQATALVDHCVDQLQQNTLRSETIATLLTSLSFLAQTIHLSDGVRLECILNAMYSHLQPLPDISDDEKIISLSAGVGLSRVIHHILTLPTAFSQGKINEILMQYVQLLDSSLPWNVGVAMGWYALLSSSAYDDIVECIGSVCLENVIAVSVERVQTFSESPQATLESLTDGHSFVAVLWVLSATAPHYPEMLINFDYLALLSKFQRHIQSDRKFEFFLPHVLFAYNHEIARLARLSNGASASIMADTLNYTLELCQSTNNLASLRQAYIQSLGPLLGTSFSFELDLRASSLNVAQLLEVSKKLYELLISRDDAKVLRLCGWTVGSILWSLGYALDSDGTRSVRRREPRTYHRLNVNSSFLRGIHDRLQRSIFEKDIDISLTLMNVMVRVESALPLTDWSPLFEGLINLDESLRMPILLLSRKQSQHDSSKCFSDFFTSQLKIIALSLSSLSAESLPNHLRFIEFACSFESISTLLKLGGIQSDTTSLVTVKSTISVSSARILDILTPLLRYLYLVEQEVENTWQITVAEAIIKTLPAQSTRSLLHRDIARLALQLLEEDHSIVQTDSSAKATCCLVECVLTDSSCTETLIRRLDGYALNPSTRRLWILGSVVVLASSASQSEGIFIKALKNAFLEGCPNTVTACVHSLLTVVSIKAVEKQIVMDWISKMLDVAILLAISCRSNTASLSALHAIWNYAISGLLSLGWGSLSIKSVATDLNSSNVMELNSRLKEFVLVLVPVDAWPQIKYEAINIFQRLLLDAHKSHTLTTSLQVSGVNKRLVTLLNCITTSASSISKSAIEKEDVDSSFIGPLVCVLKRLTA
ncbi:hypothetical protein QVD99_006320 [Batrachochytrium dendrobatidis]|nr:hypothetical protein O5D80_003334 [Batrachochytrium dendrobatidis]KAK5667108.1 hypothetical protein QVD99_006320 [Batrachochytrium dendrobatidis]